MPAVDPRLLVGPETFDDAAALKVSDDLAICFTADFITPLVDDPKAWGRIAAANSLSDLYAMGAVPLAALNLVCWPKSLSNDVLVQVLTGGAQTAAEAGCVIGGGHTVGDKEPKYGLAAIGTVHPDRILRNQGATPGDWLYLTKPLGTGILSTAIKRGTASADEVEAVVESMGTLNRAASEAAIAASAHALTDVSGFGLAGHLIEMLGSSAKLGVELWAGAVPLLPGAAKHLKAGAIPGGTNRNRDAYQPRVRFAGDVETGWDVLVYDPQTSGGLLAAVGPEMKGRFEQEASQRGVRAGCIGRFTESGIVEVVAKPQAAPNP